MINDRVCTRCHTKVPVASMEKVSGKKTVLYVTTYYFLLFGLIVSGTTLYGFKYFFDQLTLAILLYGLIAGLGALIYNYSKDPEAKGLLIISCVWGLVMTMFAVVGARRGDELGLSLLVAVSYAIPIGIILYCSFISKRCPKCGSMQLIGTDTPLGKKLSEEENG